MLKKDAIAHLLYEAGKILHKLSFQAQYNSPFPQKDDIKRLQKAKSLLSNVELLLKTDESNQPQPPDFANTVKGEVPPVVKDQHEENQKAVEGETRLERQNENTKEACRCTIESRLVGWTEADGNYCCSCGKPIGFVRPGYVS